MAAGCCGSSANRVAGTAEDPAVVGDRVPGDPVVKVKTLLNNVVPGFASAETLYVTGDRVAGLISANWLAVV